MFKRRGWFLAWMFGLCVAVASSGYCESCGFFFGVSGVSAIGRACCAELCVCLVHGLVWL